MCVYQIAIGSFLNYGLESNGHSERLLTLLPSVETSLQVTPVHRFPAVRLQSRDF